MSAPKPIDDDFLNPAQWITAKEFAAILGIRTQSLYNKISTGEDMPESYPFSPRVTRFYKPEVRQWMLKRRRVPAAVQLAQAQACPPNAALLGILWQVHPWAAPDDCASS